MTSSEIIRAYKKNKNSLFYRLTAYFNFISHLAVFSILIFIIYIFRDAIYNGTVLDILPIREYSNLAIILAVISAFLEAVLPLDIARYLRKNSVGYASAIIGERGKFVKKKNYKLLTEAHAILFFGKSKKYFYARIIVKSALKYVFLTAIFNLIIHLGFLFDTLKYNDVTVDTVSFIASYRILILYAIFLIIANALINAKINKICKFSANQINTGYNYGREWGGIVFDAPEEHIKPEEAERREVQNTTEKPKAPETPVSEEPLRIQETVEKGVSLPDEEAENEEDAELTPEPVVHKPKPHLDIDSSTLNASDIEGARNLTTSSSTHIGYRERRKAPQGNGEKNVCATIGFVLSLMLIQPHFAIIFCVIGISKAKKCGIGMTRAITGLLISIVVLAIAAITSIKGFQFIKSF